MEIRLYSLFSISLIVLLSTACTKPAQHDARLDPQAVITTMVQENELNFQAFTGIVAARVQSDLGFRVGGKITERLVDVGQFVKRGQPLMKLDPIDLNLATATQRAAVDAARASSVQADADLKRLDGLVDQGAISAQVYDLAKATADTAKARLMASEAEANVAVNAGRYAVLLADVDGIVVSTLVEPGQVVSAGEIVIRLAKEGAREAAVSFPENIRPLIGSTAQATLYGQEERPVPAQLRELSESADSLTRTFAARYVLQGAAAKAPLGSTVTIRISTKGSPGLIVPLGAIYDNGKGPSVWVFDRKKSMVTQRAVTVSKMSEETASIGTGLLAGEEIIALGAHLLHEGEVVQPVENRLATR